MKLPGKTNPSAQPVPRSHWLAAALFPVLLLLPFVNKPFHIDDTAYLAIAKHTTQHPLDYYGVSINWEGVSAPVYQWHASPPFANFYLALIGWIFGWREWVLHSAFMLPAILASVGTLCLARRLCRRPAIALFATLCTPVFVVSGTTLMLDTWLLAFMVLSVAFWVEGLQCNDLRWLAAAAGFAGLASWTKYFGIALVPLLACYALLVPQRPRFWWLVLFVPIAMIATEQIYCYVQYGRSLAVNVADVVTEDRTERPLWVWLLLGFAFCGGCTFSVMQIGAVLWSGRLKLFGAALIALMSFAFYQLNARGVRTQTLEFDLPLVSLMVYAVFILGGTQFLSLCFTDIRNRREPESWLLTLWIVGTFLFTICITWSVNARSVLPLVPPMAILAVRRLDYLPIVNPTKTNRRIIVSLIISALVSLAVARADMAWAQSARAAAEKYAQLAKSHPGAVYFQGHWGFQYYMSEAGIPPLDFESTELRSGDIVICPENNANVRPVPPEYVADHHVDTFPINRRMATMSIHLGAGFYTDLWGPLPFALGLKMPPDNYYVYLIGKSGKPFAAHPPR